MPAVAVLRVMLHPVPLSAPMLERKWSNAGGNHLEVQQRDEMYTLVAREVVELDAGDDRQAGVFAAARR
jgi:hypothetical protein